jgi:hypothetical protein
MAGIIDWSQDFENALGDGTPVTNANLVGNQFRATSVGAGNSAEIDTALRAAGNRALRLVKGSGSITRTQLYAYLGAGASTVAFRVAVRMVARPTVTETLLRGFINASGSATSADSRMDVLITSTGRLQVIDTLSGTTASSTVGLNAGSWYWVEGLYSGTTLTVRAYNLTSPTLFATVSLATMGTYTINEWAIGTISATATNLDINVDQLAFGHSDYLARTDITLVAPTVTAQADKVSASGAPATLTAAATSVSPATITAVSATCLSTTTPGVTAGSVLFTPAYSSGAGTSSVAFSLTSVGNLWAGTYVVQVSATDSNGLTGTDNVTIYVDTLTSNAESIVTSGSGTATGAADALSALRDSSDTGYVVFASPSGAVAEYRVSPVRVGGGVIVTVRAKVASTTGNVKAELYEGATNRTPGRSAQSITTSFADYTVSLTGPEVAAIIDWSNLRVRLTMTSP